MTGKTHSAAGILIGAAVGIHFQLDIFEWPHALLYLV